jgi:hypothetical protein
VFPPGRLLDEPQTMESIRSTPMRSRFNRLQLQFIIAGPPRGEAAGDRINLA